MCRVRICIRGYLLVKCIDIGFRNGFNIRSTYKILKKMMDVTNRLTKFMKNILNFKITNNKGKKRKIL